MKRIVLWIIMQSTILTIGSQLSAEKIRVATFNIWELSTEKLSIVDENGRGQNEQIAAAAAIIQHVRPDILVINEIDHDYSLPHDLAKNARLLRDAYLLQGDAAIDYPYIFAAPCNTGILAHADLDNDGLVADSTQMPRLYGNDCFGYGEYPGQYSMALLSKYPVSIEDVRTFQLFLWKDLPGHHMPNNFYSDDEVSIFRLSSKSHWDVPILINDKKIHLLLCHPTPPAFDGAEDRNGRRNFDEIKFWVHYINGDNALYDDVGGTSGLGKNEPFIIAGDFNAAPDADALYDNRTAISQLLDHPKIRDNANFTIRRNSNGLLPSLIKTETAQFGSRQTRVDYVLPSRDIEVIDGGVFWPYADDDPKGFQLAEKASDHRLVWIDVKM